MAISDPKPTVLFVHGAWHSSVHFEPFIKLLQSHGYSAQCLNLPTSKGLATTEVYEDAAFLRSELKKLIEQDGREVIVAMHSYGGFVGSMAMPMEFSKAQRQVNGLPGGIMRLLYVAAIILPLGENMGTPSDGKMHPNVEVRVSTPRACRPINHGPANILFQDDGFLWMGDTARVFYNDLPAEEANHWISKLNLQSLASFVKPSTGEDHKYHPAAYLFCTNDQAIPLEFQKKFASELNGEVLTETCDAGHSPFASQPDVVFGFIERISGFLRN